MDLLRMAGLSGIGVISEIITDDGSMMRVQIRSANPRECRSGALSGRHRTTRRDALAIEMEAAGVAQAGHLNGAAVGIVRGISDRADGTKASDTYHDAEW